MAIWRQSQQLGPLVGTLRRSFAVGDKLASAFIGQPLTSKQFEYRLLAGVGLRQNCCRGLLHDLCFG